MTTNSAAVLAPEKIVDADTHLSEPWDLWTSRAPAKFRDRVPQVREIDGKHVWTCNEQVIGPSAAVAVIDRAGQKQYDVDYVFTATVADVAAGASQVAPRLEVMDQQGVTAQLVYPNTVGFGGSQLAGVTDPELRALALRIYNEAMAEMQEESGQRLFPMAVLPWWDLDESLKELERIQRFGLVGVNTTSDPQEHGCPDLGERHWDPLWEAIQDLGLPLNFHIGASATAENFMGSAPWPSRPADQRLALGSCAIFLGNSRVIGNFIYSGILERFPTLKVVSVESGIGWIPFYLQALDYQLQETSPELRDSLSLLPSEYFRRQCYACFWFETDLIVESIKYLGVDNCLFETDYPHPTCLYPDPVAHAMRVFSDVDDEFRRKVMGGNAIRAYNLPI
jgi:predicted TIM-barrel fold metal-dependent hydrolase